MKHRISTFQAAAQSANKISFASWLGKNAANARSRALAYTIKHQQLSLALVRYSQFFQLTRAEWDPHLGFLLLARMPNGRKTHVPLACLSAEARLRWQSRISELLAVAAEQARAAGDTYIGLSRAARAA